ncbi:hypothetical protein N665_0012s0140 [Sinapis alba]|nr:hypothetical protein N665_0012s0140 [Sinapis alba]
MEPGEAQPQTKPLSRGWYALKNAKGYLHHYLLKNSTLIYTTIFTFAPTTTAIHDSDVEPGEAHPSFLSLPHDIVVNCLARISRSYYPKLSLVSKAFRSLISSDDLYAQRLNLKTTEALLHVCLQLPGHSLPSWFILPDQVLTNDMEENYYKSTGNTLLVGMHSSYILRRHVPKIHIGWVGSRFYKVTQYNTVPTGVNPSMKVARTNPVAGILDGKIYVMGGCSANESTSWAEVFDTKTKVWEPLPDPGAELRFSIVKTLKVAKGKVYVESSEKNDCFFYDPKEGRWGVAEKPPVVEIMCKIENVLYSCDKFGCFWRNTKHKEWSVVHGLEVFNRNRGGDVIGLANYGGKLIILWDMFVEEPGDQCQNKNIWCSVIALERRNRDEEVWGHVEWASIVLTVPSSYHFLSCKVRSV